MLLWKGNDGDNDLGFSAGRFMAYLYELKSAVNLFQIEVLTR